MLMVVFHCDEDTIREWAGTGGNSGQREELTDSFLKSQLVPWAVFVLIQWYSVYILSAECSNTVSQLSSYWHPLLLNSCLLMPKQELWRNKFWQQSGLLWLSMSSRRHSQKVSFWNSILNMEQEIGWGFGLGAREGRQGSLLSVILSFYKWTAYLK